MSGGEAESRYQRQILVEGIGEEGQRRIRAARVAVVGLGALGCVVADQMSRAGVGAIRLIDPDIPEISNLQRQVLIDEEDVRQGRPKALAAAARIGRANSEVSVEAHVTRLLPHNALALLGGVDLVLDGTDNFEARYLVNETCVRLKIPWVFGGVLGASGMSMAVVPGGPCLRCALGPAPQAGTVPTTAQVGVLASIVGMIGSVEVARGLKILVGRKLEPRLVVFDLWSESFRTISIRKVEGCPVCG
ncbi:MAG: HesA/MoeB/ThiF family protein [Deltaproteobacteria bacterium]|nr:HesA/MoeB/ThiF family protein [Deltaproteobacteria bacterium]